MSAIMGTGIVLWTGCGTPGLSQTSHSTLATPAHNGTKSMQGDKNQSGQETAVNHTTPAVPESNVPVFTGVQMVSPKGGWATGRVDGESALWRSDYQGIVWARVHLPFTSSTGSASVAKDGLTFSTVGESDLFLAQETTGVIHTYMTKDDGKTWTSIGTIDTKDHFITYFHFINVSDGWMVTDNGVAMHQSNDHLYRTTDGGKTWRLIAQTGGKRPPGVGYVPGVGDAVFSFDASGIGWMSGQSEVTGQGFLLRSKDGGLSWQNVRIPVPSADKNTLITTSTPIDGQNGVAVVVQYQSRRGNSTTVLHLSQNGNVTSSSAPLQTPKPLVMDFVNPSEGWADTAPYAPNQPLLYHTSDGGQSWQTLPVIRELFRGNPRIQFVTPTVGFAFSSGQQTRVPTIWRTTNGGQTWQRLMMKIYVTGGPTPAGQTPPPPPPQFSPVQIDFVSKQVGYLRGNYGNGQTNIGRLYKTIDGGKEWTEIYHGGYDIAALYARGNDVWIDVGQSPGAHGPQGALLFSKDGGKSFSRLGSYALQCLDFVSLQSGFAISASGSFQNKLMYTSDGGRTWTVRSLQNAKDNGVTVSHSGATGAPAYVSFANSQDGILLQTGEPGAGQQPKSLFRTTDGGQSWTLISSVGMGNAGPKGQNQLSSGGYANGIDLVPLHPSEAYVWESRGPMLVTLDAGSSWTASSLTKPDVLEANSVSMVGAKNGYVLIHDMQTKPAMLLERTADGGQSWQVVHQWP